ncbi:MULTISPECIES: zinc metallopeptidase [unclassified Imperialibacter]|uniref:zinc metallopeptidase n=1 Tax=unclassified Imperialibacter TaxID=2629706 RepID=UPI00125F8647|nr:MULTISPECIES: zinc metallopeptidase [unclassified Imperialibacter]
MLLLIGVVFMIISWSVSNKLKNKFKKYSQVGLASNLSGREIAEKMLADHGIYDVKVVSVEGQLTDHYNPANKTVNLSPEVYHGRSAAAAAVAAHECGHAVQHATAYSFLEFRSAMVPVQNVTARVMNIIFMAMLFGSFFLQGFMQTGLLIIIGCYFVFTLFAFVTLPVEFDASSRALAWIDRKGIVTSKEHEMAKDALKWAAMTYVVAALSALVTLFYFILSYLGMSRD